MTNTNKKRTASNTGKLQLAFLTAMCTMIFIVSFMAFLKIENNVHAFLILIIGSVTDLIIFFSGLNSSDR